MPKTVKPTFKNDPKYTGLMAVGNRPGATIKVRGKKVGYIGGASYSANGMTHSVQIAVKSDNRCGWAWLMPKNRFSRLDDAKDFVREKFAGIVAGHELHFFED